MPQPILRLLSLTLILLFSAAPLKQARTCTPWLALSVNGSNVVGNTLQINLTSVVNWYCCYRADIEIVCANANFTGAFNYSTNQICKGSSSTTSGAPSVAYQTVNIDLTQWCPGTQLKWRARETNTDYGQGNGPYTATYTLTVPGVATPLSATASAAPANVCAGQCTNLTATPAGGCGNYTYSWSPAGGNGAVANVCPVVPTTYTVTVTSNGSCGAATSTTTADVTVGIDPPPVPGVASIAPAQVCSGDNTNLSLVGYTGTIQWQSAPAPGGPWTDIAGATTANYTYGPVTADTYFQAVVSNACIGVNSNTVSALLIIPPTPNFTSTQACANVATQFTDQTPLPGTITGWQWDYGDATAFGSTQNPSHQYPAAGTYNATLTVTFNTGCTNTVTLPVNVMPMPTADFSFALACADANTAMTDLSTVAAPSVVNQWAWDILNNGSVEYNSQNPSHSFGTGGTYTVGLTVTTDAGCTGSVALPVDAAPLPVADLSATTVCIGAITSLTDQSTVASGNVTGWSWDFGDGNFAATQNPTNTYAAAGIYNVTLTVTTDNGCIGTVTEQAFVTDLPTPDFTFTQGCDGVPTPFTDMSTDVAGVAAWSWDFDGQGVSAAQNPQFAFAADGTYNVTLTVTSVGGCVDAVTYPVIVYPNPTAAFTATSVCANQQVADLTDLSTVNAPSNIVGWGWDVGADGTPEYMTQNATHTFPVGNIYQVALGVVTESGCTDVVVIPVVAHPEPVADFTGTSVCLGFNSDFTDLSTVVTGAVVQWDWTLGPLVSNQQNPSVVFPTSGNQVVTLDVTTDQGCTATVTNNVQVYVLPTASFTFQNVCLDVAAVFNSTSTIPNGAITQYDWDFGNSNTFSGQVPAGQLYPAAGNFDVTLDVVSNNGCTDTETQSITIHPIPVADFTFDEVCRPFATTFADQSTVTNGNTIAQWDWDFGDFLTDVVQDPQHTYSTYGGYSVSLEVTSNNGCSDAVTLGPVIVHADPVAEFAPDLANCLYDTTQFVSLATVENGPLDEIDTWNWSFGDGSFSVATDTAHHYTVPGIYAVNLAVETTFGCQDTVTHNVEIFPLPVPDLAADTTRGCQPFLAEFNDLSTIAPPYSIIGWEWTFGDSSSVVTAQYPTHMYNDRGMDPMSFGVYDVSLTVTSANGCVSDTTFIDYMYAYPKPEAMFTVDRELVDILDPRVKFTDHSSPNVTQWFWIFGDGVTGSDQHPTHIYPDTLEYNITEIVETDYGCLDTAQYKIEVDPVFTFYVPNSFTPNDDATNPTWGGYGTGVKTYHATVHDRWGELLFESYDMMHRWDGSYQGKVAQLGVYVYEIQVTDVKSEIHRYVGNVNVIK